MNKSIKLGVNIDHIATLRQARGTRYPDPVYAASVSELAGADAITIHLREDRRHIQDRDVRLLKETLQVRMNLEMAVTIEMINFALDIQPEDICLVPEKRQELTTEGGLDVQTHFESVKEACERLAVKGSRVSLFIDPDIKQVDAALATGAPVIELHTGCFADAQTPEQALKELARIAHAADYADSKGLIVNAGHGLHYQNVQAVSALPQINELNIGHAIVARAVFTGLGGAVREMKQLMNDARN